MKTFSAITEPEELAKYLSQKGRTRSDYLCQYTRVECLKKILENKTLLLNNPSAMNDLEEFKNYNSNIANSMYFTCFMTGQDESVGMWAMYAPDWIDGVQISIRRDDFYKLLELKSFVKQDKDFHDLGTEVTGAGWSVSMARVAYFDEDRNFLSVSDSHNVKFTKGKLKDNCLAGFVKDDVWSYEKEIRLILKGKPAKVMPFDHAVIDISDALNNMEIKLSPYFADANLKVIKKAMYAKW